MSNEELVTALQLEELSREHPSLKPIHDKVMMELADAAEEAAEEVKKMVEAKAKAKAEADAKAKEEAEAKAKAEAKPKPEYEEPKGSIHTSSNPTMVDRRI